MRKPINGHIAYRMFNQLSYGHNWATPIIETIVGRVNKSLQVISWEPALFRCLTAWQPGGSPHCRSLSLSLCFSDTHIHTVRLWSRPLHVVTREITQRMATANGISVVYSANCYHRGRRRGSSEWRLKEWRREGGRTEGREREWTDTSPGALHGADVYHLSLTFSFVHICPIAILTVVVTPLLA